MKDNFYEIKPLDEWLKPENGLIYVNNDAFVSLSVTPSAFGHANVIAKKVVYKGTDLLPEELWNFELAKGKGLEQIYFLVNREPDYIIRLYEKWAIDAGLNKSLPCRERIEIVLRDLEQDIFDNQGNIIQNIGEKAGQLIKQYHVQLIPRFPKGLKGANEALFRYLH